MRNCGDLEFMLVGRYDKEYIFGASHHFLSGGGLRNGPPRQHTSLSGRLFTIFYF
jgi:hypothetical protein